MVVAGDGWFTAMATASAAVTRYRTRLWIVTWDSRTACSRHAFCISVCLRSAMVGRHVCSCTRLLDSGQAVGGCCCAAWHQTGFLSSWLVTIFWQREPRILLIEAKGTIFLRCRMDVASADITAYIKRSLSHIRDFHAFSCFF